MIYLAYFRVAIIYITLVAVAVGALFALFHVLRQQAEAFLISHKLSKGAWIAILVACSLTSLALLYSISDSFSINPLYIASLAATAVIVYWVDVRPAVTEIQKNN